MESWKSKIIDGLEMLKNGCEEAMREDEYNCLFCPWVSCCITLKTDEFEFVEPRNYPIEALREFYVK